MKNCCYDGKVIYKKQNITLAVKKVEIDQPGFCSVYFKRPLNFTFEAGDWIDICLPNKKLSGGITYSLSSSPTEPDLRISFREGISEMKQLLQSSEPGHKFSMLQYGNDYDFQLKKNQSSILIAGGIGIAPFRSMIKKMYDSGDRNEVELIYLNKSVDFLFKNELDEWSGTLQNIKIHYVATKDLNRKKRQKLIFALIKNTNHNFYISGPPSMVEDNEHLLIDNGVQVRDIRIDSFGGY